MTDSSIKNMMTELDDGRFMLRLSKEIYEKEAILRAAHKFIDKFIIIVEPIDDRFLGVYFKPKEESTRNEIQKAVDDFCNESLDQQIRSNLEKDYGNLRDTIFNRAFTHFKQDE